MQLTTQVRVGVRIRPLTTSDHALGGKAVVSALPPTVTIAQRQFTFDAVFDTEVNQSELYDKVAPPLLDSFFEGYNATIMAYGQTGSGKTYTMGSESKCDEEALPNRGLIPRFMEAMFESLRHRKNESDLADTLDDKGRLLEYKVSASFLEVYGEDIHDLLNEERRPLPLREDADGGIVVSGLERREVSTSSEALNLLNIGTTNRTTAATLMNLTSSRSHAVFTVYMSQTIRTKKAGSEVDLTTTSKFTFVDLAGSERMKKTGAVGERAKEGIMINQGLLALGNVINALADDEKLSKKQKVHVPYRQSKLTRLLQDALGGNSQTLFLACVSPSDTNAGETLSTLKYANRARNIKNALTKNVDPKMLELQRLYSLTYLLKTELVKHRFGSVIKERLGEEDEELMKQKEVSRYLDHICKLASDHSTRFRHLDSKLSLRPVSSLAASTADEIVMETQGTQIKPDTGWRQEDPLPEIASGNGSVQNQTILADLVMQVDGINPSEEMAILDQLLEIQHRNQKYDEEHEKDKGQLNEVNRRLEREESMLLQLKESLKVYHNMKEKYEQLMTEVQQLESEKTLLADQLASANADPSKGCSLAIKKKLEQVERNLARARVDARKHQQIYRKAEQEALKCKRLERKVDEMKRSKVTLIKKQKEATAKHKEFTEAKTREVMAMKRTQRNNDKKLSKLETEIHIHKNNLARRKAYCERLSSKLKTAEDQLMQLLAMRKRDLKGKAFHVSGERPRSQKPESFATSSDEVVAMSNSLNEIIANRVNQRLTMMQYEERVAEYAFLTKSLMSQMKQLQELRGRDGGEDRSVSLINEIKQSIEDVELKLELAGSEIEEMWPTVDEVSKEGGNQRLRSTRQKVGNMEGPMARSLLLEFVERVATSEAREQKFEACVHRKESTIQTLQQDLETTREKLRVLIFQYQSRHEPSLLAAVTQKSATHLQRVPSDSVELLLDASKVSELNCELVANRKTIQNLEEKMAEANEKLALSTSVMRQRGEPHPAEVKLGALQTILHQLGASTAEREKLRLEMSTCLEDFIERRTNEATKSLELVKLLTGKRLAELRAMHEATGHPFEDLELASLKEMTSSQRLDEVTRRFDLFLPRYQGACQRKEHLVKDVYLMLSSLGITEVDLTQNLRRLLEANQHAPSNGVQSIIAQGSHLKHDSDREPLSGTGQGSGSSVREACDGRVSLTVLPVPNSLEIGFLDGCERDLKELRLAKSQILVGNVRLRDSVKEAARDMNVSADGMLSLVELTGLPSWWDRQTAFEAVRCITSSDGVVRATMAFTRHLKAIKTRVSSVSESRRALSEALKDVIERAQKTLLTSVGEEFGASEAYSTFRKALFKLPPLSQEHIQTCISELSALIPGVDAMIQSEIEALTVVWEALAVESGSRGTFWGDLDESMRKHQSKYREQICEAIRNGEEDWLVSAAKQSCGIYDDLSARLLKLESVHSEVERLRRKQDRKSKIISLDSEIRIISASLADFEERQCNKQRLLTKKMASSALLKEERFRKHMQATFSTKLNQLAEQLKEWNEIETELSDSILSDEVKDLLLGGPEKMDTIVEQRTEFMHLRTVKMKAIGKRPAEACDSDKHSPVKKQKQCDGGAKGVRTSAFETGRVTNNAVQRATRLVDAPTASSLTRCRLTKERTKSAGLKRSRKSSLTEGTPNKGGFGKLSSTNSKLKRRAPLSPNLTVTNRHSPTSASKVPTKRRETIVPFGDILSSPGKD